MSRAVVQYADLADIAKMLNLQGGGLLMHGVKDVQKLVDLRSELDPRHPG